jgi:inosose dehydratase
MATIKIGCGQITWIRFTSKGAEWIAPEDQVLAEIAEAGYDGAPAGPKEGTSVEDVLALYARHGLAPAPGYFGADFWKQERQEQILDDARRFASFSRAAGLTELYVAPGGFDYVGRSGRNRRAAAGHVRPDDGLSDDEYRQFAETLTRVGEITLAEGVRSCFHNHVGTVIETLEEIERLLDLVDPNVIFLGPDTGHLAWAGVDPVAFCRQYAERIKTIHIKDIDEAVRAEGHAQEWDYGQFTSAGIFTELGDGAVDFPTIFKVLRGVDFSGWAIVETDVTQRPTALESAVVSRNYLRSIGL